MHLRSGRARQEQSGCGVAGARFRHPTQALEGLAQVEAGDAARWRRGERARVPAGRLGGLALPLPELAHVVPRLSVRRREAQRQAVHPQRVPRRSARGAVGREHAREARVGLHVRWPQAHRAHVALDGFPPLAAQRECVAELPARGGIGGRERRRDAQRGYGLVGCAAAVGLELRGTQKEPRDAGARQQRGAMT